jgi:hypothetical protein
MKEKEAKSEALSRKKEMKATDNVCKRCGERKSHKSHTDVEHPNHHKFTAEEREEREVEKEEDKE